MKKILIACLNIVLGISLGLGLLEFTLRANPTLLLRGIGLPVPVDTPIDTSQYEVRYSDADLLYWQADQIKPLDPEQDMVEARVTYQTDEFGFPNPAPVPDTVDIVVLGRSFSMGAQVSRPWPRLVAEKTGLNVLNLSQPGNGLDLKIKYLREFGYPRQPRWVIVEVLPSMDIIEYSSGSNLVVSALPAPMIRQLIRKTMDERPAESHKEAIYPLPVEIPGQTVNLTFYSYYLASLSVDKTSIEASNQWKAYKQGLVEFVTQAREESVCVLLLYAPTKPEIYFPLAIRPEQLEPTLDGWSPWRLTGGGDLTRSFGVKTEIWDMQANAPAGRDLLVELAREHSLPYVDPTMRMMQAAKAGDSPFMVYDTHWSETGNQLVAELIAETLKSIDCP